MEDHAAAAGARRLRPVEGLIGRLQTTAMKSIVADSPTPADLKNTASTSRRRPSSSSWAAPARRSRSAAKPRTPRSTRATRRSRCGHGRQRARRRSEERRRRLPPEGRLRVPRVQRHPPRDHPGRQTVAFEKVKGDRRQDAEDKWRRVSPTAGDVDKDKIDSLLSRLSNMRATSFVDASAKTGLDTPAMTVVAKFDEGKKEERVMFGKVDDDVYVARPASLARRRSTPPTSPKRPRPWTSYRSRRTIAGAGAVRLEARYPSRSANRRPALGAALRAASSLLWLRCLGRASAAGIAAGPQRGRRLLPSLSSSATSTRSWPPRRSSAAPWGVLVQSLKTGETIYALNAGRLLMPASTLKVITLAAAAERLGWDYSYETRIVADGAVAGGTLDGNLVIVASGDPSLDRRALDSWAAQLKALGIRRSPARCWPTPAGSAARASAPAGRGTTWPTTTPRRSPPRSSARMPSTSRFGPACAGRAGHLRTVARRHQRPARREPDDDRRPTAAAEFVARRAANSPVVVLEGVVPAGSRPVIRSLSVHDPVRFLAAAFAEALLAAGITVGAAASARRQCGRDA